MKKITLLFGLLWLPFLVSAQWSVQLTAVAGVAAETSITPAYGSSEPLHFGYSALDYSFQGGVEVNYFYTSRFGLGSGLTYSAGVLWPFELIRMLQKKILVFGNHKNTVEPELGIRQGPAFYYSVGYCWQHQLETS